jgi:hypothetical protein
VERGGLEYILGISLVSGAFTFFITSDILQL